MKLLEPLAVTDGQLTTASIAEDDAPVWDAATAYVLNDRVISLVTHSVYVCETPNTGIDPDTDPISSGNWTRLGSTNRWKPFDSLLSDPATAEGSISYTLTPDAPIYGMAIFALAADLLVITATLGSLERVFTLGLVNVDDVDGWHSWLFSGVQREPEALQLDLPYFGAGTSYKVEITGSGVVEVGQIVMGPVTTLGTTLWGAEIGIQDYSRKERDAFGNAIILQRSFSRTANFTVGIEATKARRVQRKMEAFRARPAVWIGNERPEYGLIIYGFYDNYSHVLSYGKWNRGIISVNGLV